MKKHSTQEAFYQRLQELAEVNKPALKESKFRNLGTLIDYKRAADGVAYGIVKENHNYYIKKAGTKKDPNVADFAYIGGQSNITEFQYSRLSEAEKQRNMIFGTINEAISHKPSLTGSKKKTLNEDKAGEEIDAAASQVDDLDAAANDAAASEPQTEPTAEPTPDMGMDAEVPAEEPSAEPTAEPSLGGEEMGGDVPAEEPAPEGDGEEVGGEEPAPEGDGEEVPTETGDEEGGKDEIKSQIGKIGEKVMNKTLNDKQVESYVNMFLGYFKDNFKNMPIEDRKEIADKGILEIETENNIDDLEQTMPDDKEGGVEEQQCAECGGFGKYAESRGYDSPEKFMECDSEEQASVVNGYVGAHEDGMNDGDEQTISLIIKLSPDVLEKLKGDYGHEEYAEKIQPQVDSMNESEEDAMVKLNELWGGLGNLAKGAGSAIGGGLKSAGQAIAGAAKSGAEKVAGAAQGAYNSAKETGQNIKKAYNAGEINPEVKKLEGIAADLGKQVAALNKRMVAAGQEPVNVKSLLATIQNQLGGKTGQANLSKFKTQEGVDVANTEVQPNMLKEDDEVEVDDEKEFDVNDLDTGGEETTETPESDEVEAIEPEAEEKEGSFFAPPAQTLGGGVVKPSGAPTTIKIEPDKSVEITMNESEKKLRQYVRNRLMEKTGQKKPSLNESKKSDKLKKLDEIIDKQFNLSKSLVKKKLK